MYRYDCPEVVSRADWGAQTPRAILPMHWFILRLDSQHRPVCFEPNLVISYDIRLEIPTFTVLLREF
uniref:(California timema) hypothetical protein n=1 Tax=Timema californicum TaxID=61474 RepID=A0A7R9P4M6_TIMCA|nr:unnamed protein product [Timema californicum]